MTGIASQQMHLARPGGEQAPVLAPLSVLVGSALLVLAQLYLAIPLVPVIDEGFGSGGSAAAAALGTSYALAYGVGFLIFGPLSDRYGRKLILVAGLAVFAVVTAGVAAAASLPAVALLRTLQGLVAASFGPVALAYVAEALPPRWRSTGIGAMSTAFLSAGILGQVYAQAVAETLGWRWVFGLAAPACMIAALVMAMILIEPPRTGEPVSLSQKYRALGALVVRPELTLLNAASFPVILSFVGMYAALGPLLQTQFRLDDTGVLLVRLAGLPALLLAPVAGWLAGRYGATRVAVMGFLIAAAGLAAEAISAAALSELVIASVIFALGVATIVPAIIALVGSRGGSSRAGALAINGLVVFAGASCGPLAAQLPISFAGLMLSLAALLMIASGLVAISNRPKGRCHRLETPAECSADRSASSAGACCPSVSGSPCEGRLASRSQAVAWFAGLTGAQPVHGGSDQGRGTRNFLVGLGAGAYVRPLFRGGGGCGIRTREALHPTRFQVRPRPVVDVQTIRRAGDYVYGERIMNPAERPRMKLKLRLALRPD